MWTACWPTFGTLWPHATLWLPLLWTSSRESLGPERNVAVRHSLLHPNRIRPPRIGSQGARFRWPQLVARPHPWCKGHCIFGAASLLKSVSDLRLVLDDFCPEGAHDDVQLFDGSIAVLQKLRLGLVEADQRVPLVSLLGALLHDGAVELLDAGMERCER